MWEPQRLITLWAFTACYGIALPLHLLKREIRESGIIMYEVGSTNEKLLKIKTILCDNTSYRKCTEKHLFLIIFEVKRKWENRKTSEEGHVPLGMGYSK
jgi:hypothetical protein